MTDTRDPHSIPTPPTSLAEGYVAPTIDWTEVMEDAGVYAACAKDPFEPIGPGCMSFPRAGGS